MDVARGRDVSWLWLGVGVEGCTLDVAGVKGAWISGVRVKPLK